MEFKKLELGKIVATKSALEKIERSEIVTALSRHERFDWGEMSPQDKLSNEADFSQ